MLRRQEILVLTMGASQDAMAPQHQSPCHTQHLQQIACASALWANDECAQRYESCQPCVIADRQEACSIWSMSYSLFQNSQVGSVVGVQPSQNEFAAQRHDPKGKVPAQVSPRGLYRHARWVLAFNSAVHALPLPAEAPLTMLAPINSALPLHSWKAPRQCRCRLRRAFWSAAQNATCSGSQLRASSLVMRSATLHVLHRKWVHGAMVPLCRKGFCKRAEQWRDAD